MRSVPAPRRGRDRTASRPRCDLGAGRRWPNVRWPTSMMTAMGSPIKEIEMANEILSIEEGHRNKEHDLEKQYDQEVKKLRKQAIIGYKH